MNTPNTPTTGPQPEGEQHEGRGLSEDELKDIEARAAKVMFGEYVSFAEYEAYSHDTQRLTAEIRRLQSWLEINQTRLMTLWENCNNLQRQLEEARALIAAAGAYREARKARWQSGNLSLADEAAGEVELNRAWLNLQSVARREPQPTQAEAVGEGEE